MSQLLEILGKAVGSGSLDQLSQQIGADRGSTEKALGAALPMLVGALNRNTQSSKGARALSSALERDHDGSLLEGLAGLLGSGSGGGGLGALLGAAGSLLGGGVSNRAADGDGILRHTLGDRRDAVEKGVSRASGLDGRQVGQLLALLAPMVMGALGKIKRQRDLDAGGVADFLNKERQQIERQAPQVGGGGGLASILDMDGDGQIADDVMRLGQALGGSGGFLGKLLGGR